MPAKIISGTALAAKIIAKVKHQIAISIKTHACRPPHLAVVLVGEDSASKIYISHKQKACCDAGIKTTNHLLPATISQQELVTLIKQLNIDDTIDGILVQLPLPKHLSSLVIIDAISPTKDVDGFHRYNMGSLAINDAKLSPCTPLGIMHMLDSLTLDYSIQHVVILGKSNIVGRPMLLELINRGATVTVCNSNTPNLRQVTRNADIIVVAVGKPKLVKHDWLKPGCVVIDVGINRLADGELCGDVDYTDVIDVVSHITQVPGGVGPMTVAMLIKNTLQCFISERNYVR